LKNSAYRDREWPHGHSLPHHTAYGSPTKAVRLIRKAVEQAGTTLVQRNTGSAPCVAGWSHICAPDSVSVRHPVPSRHPAAAGRLPPGAPLPTPVVYRYTLRLHPAGPKTCQATQLPDMLGSLSRCAPCPAHNIRLHPDRATAVQILFVFDYQSISDVLLLWISTARPEKLNVRLIKTGKQ